MSKTESDFTRAVCSGLEALGCEIYPLVAQMMGKGGWPDRLVIHRKGVWLLEFKGVRTPLGLRQRIVGDRINSKRPGTAWVVRAQPNRPKNSEAGELSVLCRDGDSDPCFSTTRFETAKDLFRMLCERPEFGKDAPEIESDD